MAASDMQIEEFKSQLVGGGARNNLFKAILPIPGINVAKLSFLCRAASLPGSTIAEVAVPFRGRDIYVAGDRTFEVWNVTVINDIDFSIRNALETFMNNALNRHEANTSDQRPASYKNDMIVQQLDKMGTEIKTYTFRGAFPISVAPIELTYSSAGEVEEFEVSFRYDYWTSDTTS